LVKRRAERNALQLQLDELQRPKNVQPNPPSEEWIEGKLSELGSLLRGGGPAASHALRALVSGKIVVTETRRPGKQRHYLQGRMQIRLAAVVKTTNVSIVLTNESAEGFAEIVINFRQPERFEALADRAKELWDLGLKVIQIAEQLGWGRALVTSSTAHRQDSN
jgi:hypothetical protein